MPRIDMLAGELHFVDHLAPIYLALPPAQRGDFIVRPSHGSALRPQLLQERAAARGVTQTVQYPGNGDRPTLVASYGDLKVARALGLTRLACIEHGIGQSFLDSLHPSYAGGGDREDVSLFLTPNEHSANRWRQAYPRATVAVVGSPKLDSLPHREPGPGPVVAISFHWPGGWPPETRSAWDEFHPVLPLLAGQFSMLGHAHPRYLDSIARWYRRAGIPIVPDFEDVCRQADLYVCDTNSTLYEFASTGRPVVVLNKPGRKGYRRHVEHGLRFWSAANVGLNCDDPTSLAATISQALLDSPAQRAAREAALDTVYAYRTGAAGRAAATLAAWARRFHIAKEVA